MPYPYINEGDGLFSFFTDKNHFYILTFKLDKTFSDDRFLQDFSNDLYWFVIDRELNKNEKVKSDPLVSKTIHGIIIDWITANNKAIVYLCGDKDNKAYSRAELFKKWAKSNSNYYSREIELIGIEDSKTYVGLLLRNDFDKINDLLPQIELYVQDINNDK